MVAVCACSDPEIEEENDAIHRRQTPPNVDKLHQALRATLPTVGGFTPCLRRSGLQASVVTPRIAHQRIADAVAVCHRARGTALTRANYGRTLRLVCQQCAHTSVKHTATTDAEKLKHDLANVEDFHCQRGFVYRPLARGFFAVKKIPVC